MGALEDNAEQLGLTKGHAGGLIDGYIEAYLQHGEHVIPGTSEPYWSWAREKLDRLMRPE